MLDDPEPLEEPPEPEPLLPDLPDAPKVPAPEVLPPLVDVLLFASVLEDPPEAPELPLILEPLLHEPALALPLLALPELPSVLPDCAKDAPASMAADASIAKESFFIMHLLR